VLRCDEVAVAMGDLPLLVLEVVVEDGRIVEIDAVADPDRLAALGLSTDSARKD
jgi:hypothetical protein